MIWVIIVIDVIMIIVIDVIYVGRGLLQKCLEDSWIWVDCLGVPLAASAHAGAAQDALSLLASQRACHFGLRHAAQSLTRAVVSFGS